MPRRPSASRTGRSAGSAVHKIEHPVRSHTDAQARNLGALVEELPERLGRGQPSVDLESDRRGDDRSGERRTAPLRPSARESIDVVVWTVAGTLEERAGDVDPEGVCAHPRSVVRELGRVSVLVGRSDRGHTREGRWIRRAT